MMRITETPLSAYDDAQKKFYNDVAASSANFKAGEPMPGPYKAFVLHPQVGNSIWRIGQHIRNEAKMRISQPVVELAIVYTTRRARARYALTQHLKRAKSVGLEPAKIEALRRMERPAFGPQKLTPTPTSQMSHGVPWGAAVRPPWRHTGGIRGAGAGE